MKERPILFSGPMVKAILSGNKTQTRRTIKFNPPFNHASAWPFVNKFPDGWWVWTDFNPTEKDLAILRQNGNGRPCPFGQPGDRLWVRESWRLTTTDDCACYDPCGCKVGLPVYRATADDPDAKWKPSIHMPRWVSRITLEITGVKVERLQDISDDDCMAEGIEPCNCIEGCDICAKSFQEDYQQLWESINGKGSWDANPWVWVVEFKEVKL